MMVAGGDVPAELLITSEQLRGRERASAESPIELLLRTVEVHAAAEKDALEQYEYLAEASVDPVIAFVMRLILDDKVRHHGLLQRMATTLRDALEWTSSDAALPKAQTPEGPVPAAFVAIARGLVEEEQTGARALRHLAEQEKDINGGLDSLLLEMMAMDSDKHARTAPVRATAARSTGNVMVWQMNRIARFALLTMLLFLGVTTAIGALVVVPSLPLAWLAGSPFANYWSRRWRWDSSGSARFPARVSSGSATRGARRWPCWSVRQSWCSRPSRRWSSDLTCGCMR